MERMDREKVEAVLDEMADGINLDECYNSEDLMPIYLTLRDYPEAVAKALFPDRQSFETEPVIETLRYYAFTKMNAIDFRLRGEIMHAQMRESFCDDLYEGLPDWARTW